MRNIDDVQINSVVDTILQSVYRETASLDFAKIVLHFRPKIDFRGSAGANVQCD